MINPKVYPLVSALQDALGIRIDKGQITLNITDGQFRNADYRICVGDPEEAAGNGRVKPLDTRLSSRR